jgi:hypothetical protein
MGSREIDGKQYRSDTSYRDKKTALRAAKENRKGSWHARVVKEGKSYSLYTRKKMK